ncbi:MAG: ABC transporter ATP-binding protein [Bacteroidia bacterium]
MLTVDKIFFNYPNETHFKGITNISFDLEPGKVLVIAGKSGSGKTTLLKSVYGLNDLQNGQIVFEDRKVLGPAYNLIPGHNEMKLVSTGYALLEHHTVYENIADILSGYHDDFKKKKINELLRLTEMTGFSDKKVNTLSDGQRQRVALCKAICLFPKLLLLDEPFSNLDIILKEKIFAYIKKKLKHYGSSCIIVSHRLDEVLKTADYLGIMKDGKLIQLDTYAKIKRNPSNKYVEDLIKMK